jgi:Arc/MetJ-type ribon-helix-helix transcriptional regulator
MTQSVKAVPENVTVRMAPELLAKLDAWVEDMRAETGLKVTRSDAIRLLVAAALGSEKPKSRKR